jgi:hypothetical protein
MDPRLQPRLLVTGDPAKTRKPLNAVQRDIATFAVVAGLLTFVALAACLGPASRAARLEPIVALRED